MIFNDKLNCMYLKLVCHVGSIYSKQIAKKIASLDPLKPRQVYSIILQCLCARVV